ncbi:MAG TPA: 3-keto-5-aminohexanoate cleavage protein [Azospirillaceae bacterium]|nr:3-keto-5-aminohexanoate cleavage protein [Azospirillaceae bacterium]
MTGGPDVPLPVAVCAAPNGARRTKTDHPALPMTPAEIARDAAACLEAGASMLHIHARGPDGRHTLDPGLYGEVIAAVRAEVGDRMVVQATTEAAGIYAPAQQMAAIRGLCAGARPRSRPDSVSLAIRELLPAGDDSAVAAFGTWIEWVHRERILPQYILYDAEDVGRFLALQARGVIPDDRPSVLFVLGRYTAGQQSDPRDLLPFLAAMGAGHDSAGNWFLCAFGKLESACCLTAAALGGHARIGFENNTLMADGNRAPNNAALVDQLVRALPAVGRTPADAAMVRALLG